MEISRMSINDLESIKNILLSDFDDLWSYNTLLDELNQDNSYCIVVKNENNEIIGFASFKKIIDEADIMNIVVKKSCRDNGVGTFILEHFINFARSNGIKKINLEVADNNLRAIHLYDKFNFNKISIRENYYHGERDAIIMTKEL